MRSVQTGTEFGLQTQGRISSSLVFFFSGQKERIKGKEPTVGLGHNNNNDDDGAWLQPHPRNRAVAGPQPPHEMWELLPRVAAALGHLPRATARGEARVSASLACRRSRSEAGGPRGVLMGPAVKWSVVAGGGTPPTPVPNSAGSTRREIMRRAGPAHPHPPSLRSQWPAGPALLGGRGPHVGDATQLGAGASGRKASGASARHGELCGWRRGRGAAPGGSAASAGDGNGGTLSALPLEMELSLSLCPRPLSQSHHHLGRPHACNATPGHEWGFYEVARSHWNVWDLFNAIITLCTGFTTRIWKVFGWEQADWFLDFFRVSKLFLLLTSYSWTSFILPSMEKNGLIVFLFFNKNCQTLQTLTKIALWNI